MSLLALTTSACVVGGMFVSVSPAYSVDGIGDGVAQCVTASEEGASIIASSVVRSCMWKAPAGVPRRMTLWDS